MISVATERRDYVQCLLNLNIKINSATAGEDKLAPIHFAISAGNRECLELLLLEGARFNCFKDETPTALTHLAKRWQAAQKSNNTILLQGLKECADYLLFHGAGIGVQLPAELFEMGLKAERCCLFNSTMKIKHQHDNVSIDVNLLNHYPLAIHTLNHLLGDHNDALRQSTLPYQHLLNCIDLQLGLHGQDNSLEVKNLYRIRHALYSIAPKAEGGMSLGTMVLVNAKRNKTLTPFLVMCSENPTLINSLKGDLQELMQLPDLRLPLVSLETEKAQLQRVTDFHDNLRLLQRNRMRRVCLSGDECCWPWWTFGSITGVLLIVFSIAWILLDTVWRNIDYSDYDGEDYSCWQWVLGGNAYPLIDTAMKRYCTNNLNAFNTCYHDILCKTAIGGTTGAMGLSLVIATLLLVGCIYSNRLSSHVRRELTELERNKNYYETGHELAEIPESTSIRIAEHTAAELQTFWQQRCEQTHQRDLITQGRLNFFVKWMREREESVVEIIDEDYSYNSDNELENLV